MRELVASLEGEYQRYKALGEAAIAQLAEDELSVRVRYGASLRESSAQLSDVWIRLKGGRLVESGPHATLLAAGGHYAQLYRLQSDSGEMLVDLAQPA